VVYIKRAEELLMFNVTESTLDDFGHTEVTFTPLDFATDDDIYIGQLHLDTGKPKSLSETHYYRPC